MKYMMSVGVIALRNLSARLVNAQVSARAPGSGVITSAVFVPPRENGLTWSEAGVGSDSRTTWVATQFGFYGALDGIRTLAMGPMDVVGGGFMVETESADTYTQSYTESCPFMDRATKGGVLFDCQEVLIMPSTTIVNVVLQTLLVSDIVAPTPSLLSVPVFSQPSVASRPSLGPPVTGLPSGTFSPVARTSAFVEEQSTTVTTPLAAIVVPTVIGGILIIVSTLVCLWRFRRQHRRTRSGPLLPLDAESREAVADCKTNSTESQDTSRDTAIAFDAQQEDPIESVQAARGTVNNTSMTQFKRTAAPLYAANLVVRGEDISASGTERLAFQDPSQDRVRAQQARALLKIERERAVITSQNRRVGADDAPPPDNILRSSSTAAFPEGSSNENSTDLRSQLSFLRRRLEQVSQLVTERPAGDPLPVDVPPAYVEEANIGP